MKRHNLALKANPVAFHKGRPPTGAVVHFNPKWLRKQYRKELEGEINQAEHIIFEAGEALMTVLEEKVRAAKLATVASWTSILENSKARLRKLRGGIQ